MEDSFEIPVRYNNVELMVPAKLLVQGYTYKIEALINGNAIWFEPDEEHSFRAVLPPNVDPAAKPPDAALLQVVAEALSEALH